MEGQLFLSHSSADGVEFTRELATELEAGDPPVRVWRDRDEIRPSEDDWDDQLDRALRSCRAVVFVLTPDSGVAEGSVCKDEWARALQYKKPVVVVRAVDDQELLAPLRLATRHHLDFASDFRQALAQLRRYVRLRATKPRHLTAI